MEGLSISSFENKRILITGGASGIGAQTARHLIEGGAEVIITDIHADKGAAFARELGSKAQFFRHDVSSEADWNGLVETVVSAGGLHGLVNNAGIYEPLLILDTDAQSFDRHMQINQLGCFLGIQFAAKTGVQGASIVNVSSVAGMRSSRGIAYAATKWAVRGMTKTAAVELAPMGIRVNSIHPAYIGTEMLNVIPDAEMDAQMAKIPMGRSFVVCSRA